MPKWFSNLGLTAAAPASGESILPIQITFRDAAIIDLRRRADAKRWPERKTGMNATQDVQLATMCELAHYWKTDYDWSGVERRLNRLPQYMTNIDRLDIQPSGHSSRRERPSRRDLCSTQKLGRESMSILDSFATTGAVNGGHFAEWVQPQLSSAELRTSFRPLR